MQDREIRNSEITLSNFFGWNGQRNETKVLNSSVHTNGERAAKSEWNGIL